MFYFTDPETCYNDVPDFHFGEIAIDGEDREALGKWLKENDIRMALDPRDFPKGQAPWYEPDEVFLYVYAHDDKIWDHYYCVVANDMRMYDEDEVEPDEGEDVPFPIDIFSEETQKALVEYRERCFTWMDSEDIIDAEAMGWSYEANPN